MCSKKHNVLAFVNKQPKKKKGRQTVWVCHVSGRGLWPYAVAQVIQNKKRTIFYETSRRQKANQLDHSRQIVSCKSTAEVDIRRTTKYLPKLKQRHNVFTAREVKKNIQNMFLCQLTSIQFWRKTTIFTAENWTKSKDWSSKHKIWYLFKDIELTELTFLRVYRL